MLTLVKIVLLTAVLVALAVVPLPPDGQTFWHGLVEHNRRMAAICPRCY